MKNVYFAIALLLPTASSATPLRDLELILQAPSVTQLFQANDVTTFNSIVDGPVATCGENSPAYYQLEVMQAGVWKPCKVDLLVKAADGNCQGKSPRVVEIRSGLVCRS